jgi:hypothetical protein
VGEWVGFVELSMELGKWMYWIQMPDMRPFVFWETRDVQAVDLRLWGYVDRTWELLLSMVLIMRCCVLNCSERDDLFTAKLRQRHFLVLCRLGVSEQAEIGFEWPPVCLNRSMRTV